MQWVYRSTKWHKTCLYCMVWLSYLIEMLRITFILTVHPSFIEVSQFTGFFKKKYKFLFIYNEDEHRGGLHSFLARFLTDAGVLRPSSGECAWEGNPMRQFKTQHHSHWANRKSNLFIQCRHDTQFTRQHWETESCPLVRCTIYKRAQLYTSLHNMRHSLKVLQ